MLQTIKKLRLKLYHKDTGNFLNYLTLYVLNKEIQKDIDKERL